MTVYTGMIYYFGWIVLASDPQADELLSDRQLNEIDAILEPLKKYVAICERRQQNYLESVVINGNHNHDNGYGALVLSVYEAIARVATDSYGLLYMRKPEHPDLHNKFAVYRLAKGKLSEHKDHLLSPCIGTIER